MEDAMLLELENIGNGPAFGVEVEGLTADYENPVFQSVVSLKKKYMIVSSLQNFRCKIKYYDIYGNYYFQAFYSEGNEEENGYIENNSNPPEIILRTSRIRYIQ